MKTNWLATVPNNAEGKNFIATLRKYLNPDVRVILRGRGKRSERYKIDLKQAEQMAVYLNTKQTNITLPMHAERSAYMDLQPVCTYYNNCDKTCVQRAIVRGKFYEFRSQYGLTLFTKFRNCECCDIRYNCASGNIQWQVMTITEEEEQKRRKLDEAGTARGDRHGTD